MTPSFRPSVPAARGRSVLGIGDVAVLIPAARAAGATLTASGRPLSRSALVAQMRDDWHAVSTALVSLLVKALRPEPRRSTLCLWMGGEAGHSASHSWSRIE